MDDVAIRVENLSKQYPSTGSGQALRQAQDKPFDSAQDKPFDPTQDRLTATPGAGDSVGG